jgi:hypothetical protein
MAKVIKHRYVVEVLIEVEAKISKKDMKQAVEAALARDRSAYFPITTKPPRVRKIDFD